MWLKNPSVVAGEDEKETKEQRTTDSSSQPSDLPPDGGLQAWTQVLAAHLIQINTWGMCNSFGIFEEYFVRVGLESKSNIAWIGSVQIFFLFLIGSISGRALDAGYYRLTLICGAVLQLLAVFLASVSTSYWQLLLTLGVLDGLGNGCVFCPIIALVSTYFSKKRALALGVVTSGGSTGGIILPLIVERLIYRIGYPWTMRVIGFIFVFNWCLALALIRTRTAPRRLGPLIELSAFKDKAYTFFCMGAFSNLLAAYFAYYFISTFGRDIIGVSSSTSFILSMIVNGTGIIGRILPSLIADSYLGALNVYIIVTICGAAIFYSWAAVHNVAGVYIFSVFYGIIGAAVQGLMLAALTSLTTNLQKMGTRTGMVFSIVSISALIGSPIAGKLIEINHGNYLYAQIFGGSALVAGAIALCASRLIRSGPVWRQKM